jgi:hypothetical protein
LFFFAHFAPLRENFEQYQAQNLYPEFTFNKNFPEGVNPFAKTGDEFQP